MSRLPRPRFEVVFDNHDKEIEFVKHDCTREDIESCLEQAHHDNCHLDLEYIGDDGNIRLDLDSEEGAYYMVYFDEEGMYYTYSNPNRSWKKIVEFGGEEIQEAFICDDFNIVKEVFRQFIEDKTVSKNLLS